MTYFLHISFVVLCCLETDNINLAHQHVSISIFSIGIPIINYYRSIDALSRLQAGMNNVGACCSAAGEWCCSRHNAG
jgi:hypothetical protein